MAEKQDREKELLLELQRDHGYQFAQASGQTTQMMLTGKMVVPYRILKLYAPSDSHIASLIPVKSTVPPKKRARAVSKGGS